MTPQTPNGIPQLDTALAALQQLNGILAGVPALIALGVSLVQMFRDAGRSDEEAEAEVAKFRAAVESAQDFNAQWLASHPKL